MKILTTDEIKDELIEKIKSKKINNKLIIVSQGPNDEGIAYKNFLVKRSVAFNIAYEYKNFEIDVPKEEILEYLNSQSKDDGFIIIMPFATNEYLPFLRDKVLIKDLDGFTYRSQGRVMAGIFNSLPATSKAIARTITKFSEIKKKSITLANSTNLIGLPLALYLSKNGATVSIMNSSTKNPVELVKNSDIFISAIGKANYFDKKYFRDGQLLIDVGSSVVNGMVIGDIDYENLEDLDVNVITHKKGIGAVTTLSLIESLISKE